MRCVASRSSTLTVRCSSDLLTWQKPVTETFMRRLSSPLNGSVVSEAVVVSMDKSGEWRAVSGCLSGWQRQSLVVGWACMAPHGCSDWRAECQWSSIDVVKLNGDSHGGIDAFLKHRGWAEHTLSRARSRLLSFLRIILRNGKSPRRFNRWKITSLLFDSVQICLLVA